jgi:hypothetical protein
MPMYPGETLREILQRDDGFSHLRGLLRDLEGLDGSCKRLLGAYRREMGRFEDFRGKVGELRRVMELGEGLKAEIWSLLRRTEVGKLLEELDPVFTLLEGSRSVDTLALLRSPELRRLLELVEHLGVPEPPALIRTLDLEAELPLPEGLRRVRIRGLDLARGEFQILYELGADAQERKIETPLDLPFLLAVYPQAMEFLDEATRQYRAYLSELEKLRNRLISEHSRENLAHGL